jgi:hypothetical protein
MRIRVLVVVGIAIVAASCSGAQDGGGTKQETPPLAGDACGGQISIEIDAEGRRSIGSLACAGQCPDGARCREVTSAAGDRAWCGCPGFAEPRECHAVKVRVAGAWAADCDGPCPVATDVCTPRYRDLETPEGTRRKVMSCECEVAGGE